MSASGAPNGGKKTPFGAKTPQNAPNGVGKLPLGAGQVKMGAKRFGIPAFPMLYLY